MSAIPYFVLLSLLILNVTSLEQHLSFDNLINATVSMLMKCPNNTERTILLGGEYIESLRRRICNVMPIALIAESKFNAMERFTLTRHSYILHQNYRFIHLLNKLYRFVIVTSSQPLLRSILQRTKDSPWANVDGFYILIDVKTETRYCKNAFSYLWAAWEYDVLSALFLCFDPLDGVTYYTYNPYSYEMPDDWRKVLSVKARNGHPWIMFKKRYVYGQETCEDLNFDKTAQLNGYQIRLNAVEMQPFLNIDVRKQGLARFSGDNSELVKVLFEKLGATLDILVHNRTAYELSGIGNNGTMEGILTGVSNGRVDMCMNTRPLLILWKLRYTYPHTKTGLCVMTQSIQQISEFTKLITFMSPEVMAGVVIVCLITYVLFVKTVGYVRAGLEVVRIIVCVSTLHAPKVSSTRIFICMVFILFLNINTVFQSHWSSLLTVPVFYGHVDSIDNIKKLGYKLYGPAALRGSIGDPELESRYTEVSYTECSERVENSLITACVDDCYYIYHRLKEHDLHKSKTLREMALTYVTREDWPLYRRVNAVIQRMVQYGLVNKYRQDGLAKLKRRRKTKRAKRKGFKVLLLRQLAFSFYILGIGYACATIVFVIELTMGKYR